MNASRFIATSLAAAMILPAVVVAQTDPPSLPRFAIRLVDEAVDPQAQTCPPRDDRVPNSTLGGAQPGAQCLKRDGGVEGELAEAHVAPDRLGRPAVWFSLTPAGSAQFAALTTANVAHSFAVVVNGQVVLVAVIFGRISGGSDELLVARTDTEADELAAEMMAIVRDGGR